MGTLSLFVFRFPIKSVNGLRKLVRGYLVVTLFVGSTTAVLLYFKEERGLEHFFCRQVVPDRLTRHNKTLAT